MVPFVCVDPNITHFYKKKAFFVKMDLHIKSRRIETKKTTDHGNHPTQPVGFHTTGSWGQTSRSDIRRRQPQWRHEKLIWKDSVCIVSNVFFHVFVAFLLRKNRQIKTSQRSSNLFLLRVKGMDLDTENRIIGEFDKLTLV